MVVLGVCVAFSCTIYVVEFIRIDKGTQVASIPWVLLSICAITPLFFALRALYPGPDGLVCTRDSVRITRTSRREARNVRVFQIADIKRLQYVAEIFPWFGAAGCLGFLAKGKQVTCLSGLKRIDVQMILAELQGMGYDVVSDPETIGGYQSEEPSSKE
jgi:hypothetical protein